MLSLLSYRVDCLPPLVSRSVVACCCCYNQSNSCFDNFEGVLYGHMVFETGLCVYVDTHRCYEQVLAVKHASKLSCLAMRPAH